MSKVSEMRQELETYTKDELIEALLMKDYKILKYKGKLQSLKANNKELAIKLDEKQATIIRQETLTDIQQENNC